MASKAFRSPATGVGDVQKFPRASQTRPRVSLSVLDMFSSLLERLGLDTSKHVVEGS